MPVPLWNMTPSTCTRLFYEPTAKRGQVTINRTRHLGHTKKTARHILRTTVEHMNPIYDRAKQISWAYICSDAPRTGSDPPLGGCLNPRPDARQGPDPMRHKSHGRESPGGGREVSAGFGGFEVDRWFRSHGWRRMGLPCRTADPARPPWHHHQPRPF